MRQWRGTQYIGILALVCAIWGLTPGAASAGLVVTAEAPGVQSSQVSGVITENFDSFAPGAYPAGVAGAVGTYGPEVSIQPADVFGGAGGVGNYFTPSPLATTATSTLTLPGAEAYFGLWWSAADASNTLEFFSGGTLLGTFDPTTTLAALGAGYFGNPTPTFLGGNAGEKYVYLNFIGTTGTTFDEIRFTSALFESDNHSTRAAALTEPFPGTIIVGGITAVPEPSTWLLLATGLGGLLGYGWRRRQRAA